MPSEATNGARASPREPRVPRDAAALVAAAARLRGACSDAEAARVGTAEILALLRAPRDADSPSPRRLRARCGWALDHGVVDALVEAMRTHADCVSLQGLAVTCLAEIAEAFVGDADAPRVITAEQKTPSRREDDVYVFEKKLCVPRRVPFDAASGAPTRAEPCVDAFDALRALKEARRRGRRGAEGAEPETARETTLAAFLATHLAHAPFFRDVDDAARRALARAASCRCVRAHAPAFPGPPPDPTDRTLVLAGEVFSQRKACSLAAADARGVSESDLRAPLLAEDPERPGTPHLANLATVPDPDPDAGATTRSVRFVAGDALDPGPSDGEEHTRAGAEGCALVTVPGWALEASAAARAVDDGLRGFFGAAEEGDGGEEDPDGPDGPERDGRDGGEFADGKSESREFGFDSPHARLARDGAADAVLHVALRRAGAEMFTSPPRSDADGFSRDEERDSRRSRQSAALASACFAFLERLASPPCDDATRRRLGADGAVDRVVATKAAFACSDANLASDEGDVGGADDEKNERERDARASRDALDAADGALRALSRNEQNMRAAFSLGAGEIVW